jgi:hypothetical protein
VPITCLLKMSYNRIKSIDPEKAVEALLMKNKCIQLFFFLTTLICLLPAGSYGGEEKTIEISVIKNDNLINICKNLLDNPSHWSVIARINRLKNDNLIYPGQKLVIPVRLLKGLPFNGRVFFIKGDVTVRAAPEDDWKTLRNGDMVQQGNSIRTGFESAVEIIFDDGTSFYQRPDTILDIFTTQIKTDDSIWQRLILRGGQLLLNIRRISGKDSRLEIQTPAAVAAARGTDFRVTVDSRHNITSEVLQGKVDIKAMNQVVALNDGEGTRVDKGKPPLKPRKLLPPPFPQDLQTLYQIIPFRIHFQTIENALFYRIMVSEDPKGKNVKYEKLLRLKDPIELSGLDDGEYYLHGTSIDNMGIEGFSFEGKKFQVRINPVPPFIQEPAESVQLKGRALTIRWLNVAQAGQYYIEIGKNREFSSETTIKINTTNTWYKQTFQDFGTYYLRIRSVAGDGFKGIWSDTISFTMIPVSVPKMEKPEINDEQLRIRWKDQGENMTYRCQIASNEHFFNPEIEKIVEKPEIALPKPDKPGKYFVRTSTIDPDGCESDFSEPQTFEIKNNKNKWVVLGTYGVMTLLILILP